MKKVFKFLFSRMTITATIIILQVLLIIYGLLYLDSLFIWMPIITKTIEIALIIDLVNRDMPADLKMPWLAVIMLVPIAGIIIYLLFSRNVVRKKFIKFYEKLFIDLQSSIENYEVEDSKLGDYQGQSRYIYNTCNSGLFQNTTTKYFNCGEKFFPRYIEDLKKAEHFIFLEYFIIEKGLMLDTILEILKEKVKNGVEVRLMYDDIGTISKVHTHFYKEIRAMGINCVKFGPFLPFVTAVHNNRDHRKITIIDGKIGYVGGINFADEYINIVEKYGYWKDSTIRLEGDAVRQLTVFFLQLFDLQIRKEEDYGKYTNIEINNYQSSGYVQPYCDGPNPIFPDLIGENVYLNMINKAKKSIYIATPYLIIDSLTKNALIMAAKRGVDVKIFTPHIPDKKINFILTRSNYKDLLKQGVKIYEYKLGFLHTKNFLVDDEIAVVGTINLDYRSLVHHYECGIWMYHTESIAEIKEDFEEILKESININPKEFKLKWYEIIISRIISIFSPLM